VTFDVLVVGDANPDVVLSGVPEQLPFGQRERLIDAGAVTLGGSAAITACGAARLGLRTAFVGRVGADGFGRYVLDTMAERGVDVSGCVVDAEASTALTVILIRGGDRAILTAPGTLPRFGVDDIDPGLAADARHVHIGSFYLQPRLAQGLPDWLHALRDRGVTVSLDTNDDPSGRWGGGIEATLAEVDVFLPNEAEACAITGRPDVTAAASRLAELTRLPVVKCGAAGALAWSGGSALRVPGLPVEPVDTVGAGDSFNAGFLAGWLDGRDVAESLRLAVACGSLSTRATGGIAGQPTRDEAVRA
jgi:sugar/nucleoside kinase (ribokinase family)